MAVMPKFTSMNHSLTRTVARVMRTPVRNRKRGATRKELHAPYCIGERPHRSGLSVSILEERPGAHAGGRDPAALEVVTRQGKE